MSTLSYFLLLLSAVAVAFVVIPLWRHRGIGAESALERRREKNREVFRQRESELAQDLQQGLINEEEHVKLLAELQRAFLFDMEALDKQGGFKSAWSGSRALVLALAILVPVSGFVMYRYLGSGADLELPQLLDRISAAQTEEEQVELFGELADFLQQRLERRPDDIASGYMLGQLYIQLERFPEAVTVLQQLLTKLEDGPDRATVLGMLSQAQYLQADSQITPEVQKSIDEALKLSPNEYAVMGLLAIDALLKQDFVGAMSYWRRQLSSATPGSAQAEEVRQRIALIEDYLPEEALAEASGPTITVTIDVAPELAAQVTDDMRLFVFVRNENMPMPILAQNLDVPEFPFTLTLDNSMSMTGVTLESAAQLVVGARLSRSGTATQQSGDLQTLSEPFALSEQTEPVELVIDEIAP